MASLPFKIGIIDRQELPAYERKGAVAQELFDRDIVVVKFSQTKTTVESGSGLPLMDLHKDIYKTVPRSGIKDTTVVGSVEGNTVWLLDVIVVEGTNVKGKSWRERLEILKVLCDGFSTEGVKRFPRAKIWDRGLMRVHSEIKEKNGAGLFVRLPESVKAFVC